MDEEQIALVADIWGRLVNSDDYEEFKRVVFEFTILAKTEQLNELFSSMIISTAIIAKQQEFENLELRSQLQAITNIFKPDAEMMDNKEELQDEKNFKDDNIVDLASRRKK